MDKSVIIYCRDDTPLDCIWVLGEDMRVIGKEMVEISKGELDALFMIVNDKCCEGCSSIARDMRTMHATNLSVTMEEFIWGKKRVSEETLLQTIDFIRREERNNADSICGQV